MLPAIAREGLADAVDAFCEEDIGFSPEQTRQVFAAARAAGLPVKLHADQLSNAGGARLAAEAGALSADHLEYTDADGVAAMAKAGTVAVLLPGAYYVLRETQAPPVALFREHRVPMALATDCNPGTSPMTSLLLVMNMGATLFRLTVEECLAGVTREAARALGRLDEIGTLEHGQMVRPRRLEGRTAGRARLLDRAQPAARPRMEGAVTERVTLVPGSVPLADWRAIYFGADVALDPAAGARSRQARRRSRPSSRKASPSTG